MVNLELYKTFVIVARELNITRASEILYISQPAVTKQIKNLEYELNTKLFFRTNHGIVLTNDGKILYDKINECINVLMKVENEFKSDTNIILGIHASISRIFGKCINEFYISNINNSIIMVNHENEDMLRELAQNELNIIFSKKIDTKYTYNNIKYINLGSLTDILITHKNSKWANKVLTLDDLKDNLFYMPRKLSETPKNFFTSTKTNINDFHNLKNIAYLTMMEIMKDTDAVGLVTKDFFINEIENNELVEVKTDFNINKVEFGIYINDKSFKELNDFITIIKNNFKK